jgi:hypothetical protein
VFGHFGPCSEYPFFLFLLRWPQVCLIAGSAFVGMPVTKLLATIDPVAVSIRVFGSSWLPLQLNAARFKNNRGEAKMCVYKTFAGIAVLAILVAAVAPASASTTNFAGTAYNNWEDETPFVSDAKTIDGVSYQLEGYVSWVVYAPGSFPDVYKGLGYEPKDNSFTYVYQVFSTGNDQIHALTVDVENQADNIGSFGSGVAPGTAVLSPPDTTYWTFPDPHSIGQFQSSQMLAFSSLQSPEEFYGQVFDGGNIADLNVLPGPGSLTIVVPEPSTLCLGLIGLGMWVAAWAARRR